MSYQRAYQSLMRAALGELLPDLKEIIKAEKPKKPAEDIGVVTHDSYREIRQDMNAEEKIRRQFESVRNRLRAMFPDETLRKWSQNMSANVNKISKKNTITAAKTIDLEVEPLLKDGKLNPFFENVVDENVGLIRSIPEKDLEAFKNKLVHSITQDHSKDTIARIISKHFDVSKRHARVIARDQVNKLNGTLNKHRQQQLGGRRYIWRTAGDERVRGDPAGLYPRAKPSHFKLDGTTQFWSRPPKSGPKGERLHPGQSILCRCWAEFIFEDIVDT